MSLQTKVIGRQPTDHGPYDPNLAYGKKFQCTLFGCAWESLHDNNNTAPAVWDGGDTITPNLVDWKKVSGSYEAWLMNHDKPAASEQYPFNGMGRVTLQKNIVNGVNTLTQAMLTQQNTIYVIQYDFTLGEDITVPENCVLEFDGGSILGAHTITGANTGIQAELVKIFNTNVTLAGTWNVAEAYPEWFGAKGDGITDDVDAIQNCLDFCFISKDVCKLQSKTYNISKPLIVWTSTNSIYIEGNGKTQTIINKTTDERTNLTNAIAGVSDSINTRCIILLANANYKDSSYVEVANSSTVFIRNLTLTSTSYTLGNIAIYSPAASSCTFENIYINNCTYGIQILFMSVLNRFINIDVIEADYAFYSPRIGVGSLSNTTNYFERCHTAGTREVDFYFNGACVLVNCAKDGYGWIERYSTFIKTNSVADYLPLGRSRYHLIDCHIESIDDNPTFDLQATTMIIDGGMIEIPWYTILKARADSQILVNGVTFWDYKDDGMFNPDQTKNPVLEDIDNLSTIHYNECYIQENLFKQAPILKNKNKYLLNKYVNDIVIKDALGPGIVTATRVEDYIDYTVRTGVDKSIYLYLGEDLQQEYNRLKIIMVATFTSHSQIVYMASDEIDTDGIPTDRSHTKDIAYNQVAPYYEYTPVTLGNIGETVVSVSNPDKRTIIGCNLLNYKYHFLRIYLSLNEEFHIKMYKVELD